MTVSLWFYATAVRFHGSLFGKPIAGVHQVSMPPAGIELDEQLVSGKWARHDFPLCTQQKLAECQLQKQNRTKTMPKTASHSDLSISKKTPRA